MHTAHRNGRDEAKAVGFLARDLARKEAEMRRAGARFDGRREARRLKNLMKRLGNDAQCAQEA